MNERIGWISGSGAGRGMVDAVAPRSALHWLFCHRRATATPLLPSGWKLGGRPLTAD